MAFDMEQLKHVQPGRPVHTADGDHIGNVKELRQGFFKVDARMQPDYWLQMEFITEADEQKVTMEFNKDDLGRYKVADPGDVPSIQSVDRPSVDTSPYPETTAAATLRAAEGEAERRG